MQSDPAFQGHIWTEHGPRTNEKDYQMTWIWNDLGSQVP